MAVNWPGLAAILVFYTLILCVGLYAAWKRRSQKDNSDEIILAGRSIGPFVGLMTMTATWVGGGYINGTAEVTYTSGLLYCQAPFGYAISLGLGGLFFAKKMRDAEYKTMLDPLQECFGKVWGSMLYLPALAGETLWSASILAALGSTLSVILGLTDSISIIVSAGIAIFYTLFGGLYSVAYTDVVQLFCIAIGLWLAVPFSMQSEFVGSLDLNSTNWLGDPPTNPYEWGAWWDYAFLLICGGIPWQVYFQRVLSAKSGRHAQFLSIGASVGCMVMAIPAVIIGIVAKATDWESTAFNQTVLESGKQKLVLPLVLQYLTPPWVAFIGLGAVSAAVMSSADSSVLSAASMFTHNIYKGVLRRSASTRELNIVLRIVIPIVGAMACAIAIYSKSIYALFYLCGDFVYVMLFPQLTLAVHWPNHVNRSGSIAAYFLGFTLRILGGEKVLGIPAVLHYPWFDYANKVQNFPFRTLSMLVTLVTLLLVSRLTRSWDSRQQNLTITSQKASMVPPLQNDKGRDNFALDKF